MSSLGDLKRRGFVAIAAAPWASSVRTQAAEAAPPERRFHDAALAMRELALSWGDQPYGAVLVQWRARRRRRPEPGRAHR
ncbi:MAG TPA: hypothetical protein VIV84_06945 [Burkholderiaceae bacterium]